MRKADGLLGQEGNDLLTGGRGGGRFVFSGRGDDDVITDFTDGLDMIRHNGGTILLRGPIWR